MSLHFDVAVALDLKESTPQNVIDAIGYLVGTRETAPTDLPDHEFFRGPDWYKILQAKPEATHCPGDLYKTFRKALRFRQQGVDHHRFTLAFRCYMLDDEFYEVFYPLVAWLALHSETIGYVGHYREELCWWPTLIFFKGGEVYFRDGKEPPEPMRKEAPPWLGG
jgi:hypothetical protein